MKRRKKRSGKRLELVTKVGSNSRSLKQFFIEDIVREIVFLGCKLTQFLGQLSLLARTKNTNRLFETFVNI